MNTHRTLILSAILGFLAVPPVSAALDDGLIAYYSFDACDATDDSGNGNDGTIGGNAGNTSCVAGVRSNALHFTGNSATFSSKGGHVLLPEIDILDTGRLTICLWVHEEAMNHPHGEAYIVFGNIDFGGTIEISSDPVDSLYPAYHRFGYWTYRNDTRTGAVGVVQATDIYMRNRFIHHCLVHNGTASTTWVYRDGVFQTLAYGQFIPPGGSPAAIARHWWGSSASSTRFTGSVDEVRIYDRALSATEVTELFQQGSDVLCDGQVPTIVGTLGDDVLYGTSGNDIIHGRRGHDRIRGLAGDDLICGGTGDDWIHGGWGQDQVLGGPGHDVIRGGEFGGDPSQDELGGGSGNDTCIDTVDTPMIDCELMIE